MSPSCSCPHSPRCLWKRRLFISPQLSKTRQLTFQRAGRTSWCLCGGHPWGFCVACCVDSHTGSSLSANTFLSLSVLSACVPPMSPPSTFSNEAAAAACWIFRLNKYFFLYNSGVVNIDGEVDGVSWQRRHRLRMMNNLNKTEEFHV